MSSWATWDNPNYLWIVICKNYKFHRRENATFGHRIILGETDAFSPLPAIKQAFRVRCDECGQESEYRPEEVLRFEGVVPDPFSAHPLFRDS